MSVDLGLYRVEHREDTADAWDRPHPPAAGWAAAVAQLREAIENALDGLDNEPDAAAWDCVDLLGAIEGGRLDGPVSSGFFSGRCSRIVSAGPSLRDPMAAWLRFLLVRDHEGRAPVTIWARSGRSLHGTVAWDGFDSETVAGLAGGDFAVLRTSDIESFTLGAAPQASA
jgi:hypothetical protein